MIRMTDDDGFYDYRPLYGKTDKTDYQTYRKFIDRENNIIS